jgi:hypothetical protein
MEGFYSEKAQNILLTTFEGSFEHTKHLENKKQGVAFIQLCALQPTSGRICRTPLPFMPFCLRVLEFDLYFYTIGGSP